MNKRIMRLKRAKATRCKLKQLGTIRFVIYRSRQHIYAQIIDKDSTVLTSASTLSMKIYFKKNNLKTYNIHASTIIGRIIAEKTLKLGIKKVSFDRSGYLYHGRIKNLAESARKIGLKF